jgi:serine/threonine-protein kinase
MRPAVDSAPVPLVATSFRERSPSLSADGKWLAYASDETGRFEVFVRPFPEVSSGKWQISTAGGSSPRWSRTGDELFFIDGANDMQAVRVATKPAFGVLERRRLFSANGYFVSPWAQAYDVSPDGKRFLMLRVGSSSGSVPVSVVLVQNFLAELQRRVP